MRHANQNIRSLVTLIGYHKAQNRLSRNKLEGSISFEKPVEMKNDSKPALATRDVNAVTYFTNYVPLSESQRRIIVAQHRGDNVPELIF